MTLRSAQRAIPLALSAALAVACQHADGGGPACAGQAWQETRLYLGQSVPDGREVEPGQWRAFLDAVVAPRFPDGFTVLDGTGFWRDRVTAETGSERSKVLVVLHDDGAASRKALEEIAADYIVRFDQQAVLRADRPVCVNFYSDGRPAT
ncbi:MAG: DUF3574 domain-containing protein [Kiloniellales bacterium]|nr:DUF3574 domain-containing protein [Kiloniellales bacterium]